MRDEYRDHFAEWGTKPLLVETSEGETPMGRVWGEPRSTEPLATIDETKLVRTSSGEEVTSSSVVYAPLDYADWLTEGSRVTHPDGRRGTVVLRAIWDTPGFPAFVEARLA